MTARLGFIIVALALYAPTHAAEKSEIQGLGPKPLKGVNFRR